MPKQTDKELGLFFKNARHEQKFIDDAAVMVHGYYNSNMCSDKSVDGAQISVADYYWISTDIKPAK